MTERGKGDINSLNRTRRSERGLTIVRENFICMRCGHHKAFKKRGFNICTKCKKENKRRWR